jgi:flagellar hook-associated protein 3 FlgL
MRVTNQMISDQVIFNLGRSLDRFMRLQAMMSTGKRIIRPSDDPVGTQKDLRYRQTLSELAQYKSNITGSLSLLASYDNVLGEMKNIVSNAYEIAVMMASDSSYAADPAAREAAVTEVKAAFDMLLSLANSKVGGRYIFSGYRTNIEAFRGGASGVEYMGDNGIIDVEIEPGTKVGINLIGADFLFSRLSLLGENADLKAGIDGSTALADLNLGNGVDLTTGTFEVTDNNLGLNVTIDISTAVTVQDAINLINNQLVAGGINNLTVDLGLEGNNLQWIGVKNGLISGNTPLSNLNAGYGVDLSDGRIVIHNDDDSISVDIDLSSAANINDVINTINNTLTASGVNNVTAAVNAAGTGIDITDTNGVPLGLTVDHSVTAFDLGIVGNIDPVLSGRELNPELDFSVEETAADQTTAADLGLLGDFSLARSGDPLRPIILDTTPLALLNNGLGYDLGQIKISQGLTFIYFDLGDPAYTTIGDLINALNGAGLDIQASINPSQTGIQIESTVSDKSLTIQEVDEGRSAHDLGIFGSRDIMGTIMILIDALGNANREEVEETIGNLNLGMQALLSARATVGARVIRLETTDSRLTDLEFNFTKLLSEEEDADLTKLVSDLALQENCYQAALIASAKIIQPSLLDFLK